MLKIHLTLCVFYTFPSTQRAESVPFHAPVSQQNLAVANNGVPLTLYRGEYGPDPLRLNTRLGSLTFSTAEAASHYATHPNNNNDAPEAPRVFPVHLTILNPVINTPQDPFMEMQDLIRAIGFESALHVARRHTYTLSDTQHWCEHIDVDRCFGTVAHFLDACPHRLCELYGQAYRFLDDPEVIRLLRKAGYDGAIYAGSGVTMATVEYRVFSTDQIRFVLSSSNRPPYWS